MFQGVIFNNNLINILLPSSLKFQKLINFVCLIRGTKKYSDSELNYLKPYKTIILDTMTANLSITEYGITTYDEVIISKRNNFE